MSLRTLVGRGGIVLGMMASLLLPTTGVMAQATRHCSFSCQRGTEVRVPTQVANNACSTNSDCVSVCQSRCAVPNQNGFDTAATCVMTGQQAPRCVGSSSVGAPYDPFAGRTVPEVIGQMIQFLLGLVGALMLVMFIYGGVTWMLAQGDPKSVASAKTILRNAVIGMTVTLLSYAILSVLIGYLGELNVEPVGFVEEGATE